jgi:hypothetical protein
MIAHQLGMKVAKVTSERLGRARVSYERLYDILTLHLIKLPNFCQLVHFDPDPRHVTRDKRARKSPVESGIIALT